MRVSIVGSGWVGTAIGKGLAKMGNYVIFHDIVDKELPNWMDADWILGRPNFMQKHFI